jgi:hypothetical protein
MLRLVLQVTGLVVHPLGVHPHWNSTTEEGTEAPPSWLPIVFITVAGDAQNRDVQESVTTRL